MVTFSTLFKMVKDLHSSNFQLSTNTFKPWPRNNLILLEY